MVSIRKHLLRHGGVMQKYTETKTDPFHNISYGNVEKEQWVGFIGNTQYPFNIEMIGVTYPDPNYFIQRKNSDYFIIEYVVSGKGYLNVNGSSFTLDAGDVYILPPQTAHSYRADKNTPYQKIWCNFYSTVFKKVMHDYNIYDKFVFRAPECKSDFEKLLEIAAGSIINDDIWPDVATVLFSVFNKIAVRYYHADGRMTIAAQAKEILDNSVYDYITVQELSKQLFVSKVRLSSEFKKVYGLSPYGYLLSQRISQAKLFLRSTDMTVKEISEKLCFADEHYFSNIFKRKTGVTPSTFRKSK